MKKNLLSISAMLLLTVFLGSCAMTNPGLATNNKSVKEGVASRTIWFNIAFGTTDISIIAAAKQGGIKKVATVESGVVSRLFRKTYVTKVTGE